MKKRLLLGTIALAAMTSSVLAADLPSRRAPPVFVPPPIPVFSWTGFYVGGQVGFGFGRDNIRYTAPAGLAGAGGFAQPNGIIGGGHVGYNFSTQSLPLLGGLAGGVAGLGGIGAGGLVIGIEGDFDGSDYRDSMPNTFATPTFRNQIQGSARGRLGVAVDRALFYATGGAAFAQFQTTYALPTAAGGFSSPGSTRIGYTVGGGVEYAITTQWSLRAEYRYSDFGTFRQQITPAIAANRREIMERAQVGFSYKFDTPVAPVVARY